MALPEQERYRIKELADHWNVSEEVVEYHLETGKLTASIVLTHSMEYLRFFEIDGSIPPKDGFDFDNLDDGNLEAPDEDVDIEAKELIWESEPNTLDSCLYHINRYDLLEWDNKSECDLKKCRVRLTDDSCPNYFYVFEKSKIINKDQIRITRQSVERFLKQNSSTHLADAPTLELCLKSQQKATLAAIAQLLRSENISPKLEAAISACLAVYFSGNFNNKLGHTKQIEKWLKENRKEVVEKSKTALIEISKVVNNNPDGGLPRVSLQ